ncbi:Beta-galactosidase-1-like protein 2 [Tyrophagus putrescentiae]|nr:Beta-galactosidase-1-like protein 2 [Tyrophagus putrescentiae]
MRFKNLFLLLILQIIFTNTTTVLSKRQHRKYSSSLPTLYEYYLGPNPDQNSSTLTGLQADNADHFTLNGRPLIIYGGSLHYFRVHHAYWRQTLQRFKAAGINTVQTYLPWNMHEPLPGRFDFGGASSPGLDLGRFLAEIRAADMFAVVRVGPYICAEVDLGGLPPWLLRDPGMRFRELYPPFMDRVRLYWEQAFQILNRYQFTNGGPIIMLQIENEYFGPPMNHSLKYLETLKNMTRELGFSQLLFTSDPSPAAKRNPVKSIPDLLETANLNEHAYTDLMELRAAQPGRPVYVSEFWPGWFDSWNDSRHHRYDLDRFDKEVGEILFRVNGSINFYMFIGGTNFGFMNGARVVTSYDYDAPLTEAGNLTDKYFETRALYDRLVASGRHPKISLPDSPPEVADAVGYGNISVGEWLPLERLLKECPSVSGLPKPVPMEMLPLGPGYGQSYGFVLYRVEAKAVSSYQITGPIADRALFLVDGNQTAVIPDRSANFSITIDPESFGTSSPNTIHQYDVLRKGINSEIKLNGAVWNNVTAYSMDFNRTFMWRLSRSLVYDNDWIPFHRGLNFSGPALYRAVLTLTPNRREKFSSFFADTYLLLPGWTKGVVFLNGFNLGRYWGPVGPQQTLYVPGPLLKAGPNTVDVFELHRPGSTLAFIDGPILEKGEGRGVRGTSRTRAEV